MDAKRLYEIGDQLFSKRSSLLNLWQEIAENFYPERADFTSKRSLGDEFAANLTTSYPVIARRDLGNAFATMLRPGNKAWFNMTLRNDDSELEHDAKSWLERATKIQYRVMHHPGSLFTKATAQGDHDFAAFGQCAISVEMNKLNNGLLYRCWHLRDMAWAEDEEGKIAYIFRRWKPPAHELMKLFPGKLHKNIVDKAAKDPFYEFSVMHMVVRSEVLSKKYPTEWVSIFYDCDHNVVIEDVGMHYHLYVIPRWQTVSGSQYAYSPSTVAALPDARLLQAMTYTLLEAGEKHTNPPMIAVKEALRSDLSIYAGGVTWVDSSYDERLGEVLRPLTQDKSGMPLGLEMAQDTRAMIMQAFYLNKLNLPQRSSDMTAYEVGQRIQQYIREALPLFEPMEVEYNGALCDMTFDLIMRAGGFGPTINLPRQLQGADIQFNFESPLHDAIEKEKGNRFLEAQSFILSAAQMDPASVALIDAPKALRDVLHGIKVPTEWTRSKEEVEKLARENVQQVQAAQAMETVQQGAEVAKTISETRPEGGLI